MVNTYKENINMHTELKLSDMDEWNVTKNVELEHYLQMIGLLYWKSGYRNHGDIKLNDICSLSRLD